MRKFTTLHDTKSSEVTFSIVNKISINYKCIHESAFAQWKVIV